MKYEINLDNYELGQNVVVQLANREVSARITGVAQFDDRDTYSVLVEWMNDMELQSQWVQQHQILRTSNDTS